MSYFKNIIEELSREIDLPLHLHRSDSISLNINNQLQVALEERENQLLVATFISELPPGKFREELFIAALKENQISVDRGILSYSNRNNQLALFSYLRFEEWNGSSLADFLEKFIEKALLWKRGVETGSFPQSSQDNHSKKESIFNFQKI